MLINNTISYFSLCMMQIVFIGANINQINLSCKVSEYQNTLLTKSPRKTQVKNPGREKDRVMSSTWKLSFHPGGPITDMSHQDLPGNTSTVYFSYLYERSVSNFYQFPKRFNFSHKPPKNVGLLLVIHLSDSISAGSNCHLRNPSRRLSYTIWGYPAPPFLKITN